MAAGTRTIRSGLKKTQMVHHGIEVAIVVQQRVAVKEAVGANHQIGDPAKRDAKPTQNAEIASRENGDGTIQQIDERKRA